MKNRNILISLILIVCIIISIIGFYKNSRKAIYDRILPYGFNLFKNGLTRVLKDGEIGLVNDKLEELIKPQYRYITTFEKGLAVAKKPTKNGIYGKIGLIDKYNNIILPFMYDYMSCFARVCVVGKGGKFGIVNLSGEQILPYQYDQIKRFNTDLVQLFGNGKTGLAKLNGDIVIHTRNNEELDYSYSILRAKIDEKWYLRSIITGYILSNGYKYLYPENPHLLRYSKDSKHWGLLSVNGEELTAPIFDNIRRFHINDYNTRLYPMKVQKNRKYGLYNAFGKLIVKPIYDDIKELGLLGGDDCIVVIKDKKQGLIDSKGKKVLDVKYDKIKAFQYRSIAAKSNNKWEVFDENGKLKYDYKIDDFKTSFDKRDVSLIKQNGIWKLINYKSGKILKEIPFKNVRLPHVANNYIYITKDGKQGLIDYDGNEIIKPLYDNLYLSQKIVYAEKSDKKGVLDLKSNIIVPFEYENIDILNDEFMLVKKDKLWQIKSIKTNKANTEIKFKSLKKLGYSGLYKLFAPKKLEFIEVYDEKSHSAILDISGKIIVPFGKHRIEKKDDMFFVQDYDSKKVGFYNFKGKNIVPIEYNNAQVYNDGYMLLQSDKKWWIKDRKTLKTLFSNN